MYRRVNRADFGYRLNVAIDVDETLYPFNRQVSRLSEPVTGRHLTLDEVYADWFAVRDAVGQEMRDELFAAAGTAETMIAGGVIPGAAEGVRALVEAGARIIVITARGAHHGQDVVQYLERFDIPYHELYVGRMTSKVPLLVERNVKLIVDDSPQTMAEALDAGITAAGLVYPYNRDVAARLPVIASRSWDELTPRVVNAVGMLQPNARLRSPLRPTIAEQMTWPWRQAWDSILLPRPASTG